MKFVPGVTNLTIRSMIETFFFSAAPSFWGNIIKNFTAVIYECS
jgi:hypothetical protein